MMKRPSYYLENLMKHIVDIVSDWLLSPHSRVTNRESIQRARLLSAILLVLMVLDSMIIALVLHADPDDITEPTVGGAIGLLGVCAVMYALNKAGYTRIAAIGLILPITGIFIYIPFFSGESPIFLAFMLIPVVLTALFFSMRWTTSAAFALLTVLYLLIAQQDHTPENLVYWNMRNLWYFLTIATGLILTFMWHGNTLENIRQQDLKRINEELQESEARLRALVENTPDFIVEVNRQGDILFINQYPELYLGKNIRDVLHPEQLDHAFEVIEKAFSSGEPQAIELQTIAPTGQMTWNSVRIGPVKQGDAVTSLTVILTNITAQKEAQEKIRQINVELEQRVADRTEELRVANEALAKAARLKDEFLASMSHELRTPLTGILAFAQSLQKQNVYGALTEKQLKAVRSIEDSGKHLLELINDILDLSKIEAGKMELELGLVLADEIAQASLRLVKQMAVARRQNVGYSLQPLDLRLRADGRRLKQMLVNLLSNAAKFTPEGGELGLEIAGDSAQHVVRFTVWDKGIGVAPENITRLFRVFAQLDSSLARQYVGTGLGLALVRRMAEMHGGSVNVESALGAGSRFTIVLPWDTSVLEDRGRAAQAEAPNAHPVLVVAPPPSCPRLLLAEDNEVNIQVLSDYLEASGYSLLVARNGSEAVQQARDEKPQLILMDIQMPGMDGLEATRRIRQEPTLVNIPIIALTALAMPGDRERCLAAGADDYLTKPVNLELLIQKIREQIKP